MTKPLTVREACRRAQPLDGADAQALEHALTTTERERDEAREDYRRQKQEALDAFTAVRAAMRDLDQLRTSVLSIAAQIDRAADARAAAVLIGQPPSGAATVYDLRAFAGDLRRAVEAPRDTDA